MISGSFDFKKARVPILRQCSSVPVFQDIIKNFPSDVHLNYNCNFPECDSSVFKDSIDIAIEHGESLSVPYAVWSQTKERLANYGDPMKLPEPRFESSKIHPIDIHTMDDMLTHTVKIKMSFLGKNDFRVKFSKSCPMLKNKILFFMDNYTITKLKKSLTHLLLFLLIPFVCAGFIETKRFDAKPVPRSKYLRFVKPPVLQFSDPVVQADRSMLLTLSIPSSNPNVSNFSPSNDSNSTPRYQSFHMEMIKSYLGKISFHPLHCTVRIDTAFGGSIR